MKITFKLLFAIILFNNCSSDDINQELITEEPIKNNIELKINDQPSNNRINGLSATFCCNKEISVSFDNLVDLENGNYYGGSGFHLSLDTNGNLLSLWYKSYNPNNEYYSPFFHPTATLNITDFEFVENQILKFKISGQIFKETYDFSAEPEFVQINANIEIKNFHRCSCDSFSSKISSENGFIFHKVTRTLQENNIGYFAYSNNGYHLEFKNFDEYIKNMPLGIYEFDENSTSQRIDFRQFIGVPRAFIMQVIPQEWLKYKTSGNFEIMERYQQNGEIITKVKFNFVAKNNNEVIFQFQNAILETQM